MKLFVAKEDYPLPLGVQCKELEIVHFDVTKGDEGNNNSKDIFSGPLAEFNLMEESQRKYSNQIKRMEYWRSNGLNEYMQDCKAIKLPEINPKLPKPAKGHI